MAYDNSDTAFKIYTGGFFHPTLGRRAGLWPNAGKARRLGGNTEAHGFNLSLVRSAATVNEQIRPVRQGGYDLWPHPHLRCQRPGRTDRQRKMALACRNGVGRAGFTPVGRRDRVGNHKLKFSDGEARCEDDHGGLCRTDAPFSDPIKAERASQATRPKKWLDAPGASHSSRPGFCIRIELAYSPRPAGLARTWGR